MKNANGERKAGHYVYLFRDPRGIPLYAGYGRDSRRATSHLTGSHNQALARAIKLRGVTLEIAGPFDSEQTGRAVETAVMSALHPRLNVAEGDSQWRFRVLGVPAEYADRLVEPGLLRRDFLARSVVRERCPVVFVLITEENLRDGRGGYDPANPPSDDRIRDRVEAAWQLGRRAVEWERDPTSSPRLLVGVTGPPAARTVVASLFIDRELWGSSNRHGDGKVSIPTSGPADLDALRLRGRRLSAEAGISFGSWTHQQFVILFADGSVVGGRKSVRDAGWK